MRQAEGEHQLAEVRGGWQKLAEVGGGWQEFAEVRGGRGQVDGVGSPVCCCLFLCSSSGTLWMEHVDGTSCLQLNGIEVLLAMPEKVYCRSVDPAALLVVAHGVVGNELEVLHEGSEGSVLQSPQLLAHAQEGHGVFDDIEVVWRNSFGHRNAEEALGVLLLEEADDLLQGLEVLLLSC